MKIVVMASGDGSTFQAIIERCVHAKVAALITNNRDAFALLRAASVGIPTAVCKNHNMADTVRMFRPDLVVLAGYMRILPPEFIKAFPHTINIHPSLLPKYKGLNTYQRALNAGDTVVGTTVHWATEELDAGKIIAQHEVPVNETDTAQTLQQKVQLIEQWLYPATIDNIAQGLVKT